MSDFINANETLIWIRFWGVNGCSFCNIVHRIQRIRDPFSFYYYFFSCGLGNGCCFFLLLFLPLGFKLPVCFLFGPRFCPCRLFLREFKSRCVHLFSSHPGLAENVVGKSVYFRAFNCPAHVILASHFI